MSNYKTWSPIDHGEYYEIPLTHGRFAKIDKEDIDKVREYAWHCDYYGYAVTTQKKIKKDIKMHRLVTDCPKDMIVDHKNHDTTDNRKQNLRICKKIDNQRNQAKSKTNKSGMIGVSWSKKLSKWTAQVYLKDKKIHIGVFTDFEEAVKAREKKAREIYGEFFYNQKEIG